MVTLHEAIRDVRLILGVAPAAVAEAAGVDTRMLLRFEGGEQEIPGDVLWRLSEVLGVPFDELDEQNPLEKHLQALAVRFSADRGDVGETVRFSVARAALVARKYVELEELAERPSRYRQLSEAYPDDKRVPTTKTWMIGRELALMVREKLHLDGPIDSMLQLVQQLGIFVIWQRLPSYIAGYAMCDEIHGPTIVVNINGRNLNELVRRFTLAHEACHVLFDRYRLKGLSTFDVYDDFFAYSDGGHDRHETRANAFAIHLLAPEKELTRVWWAARDIRTVMTQLGISFEAARHHLANYNLFPFEERIHGVSTDSPDRFKVSESPELWYPAFENIPLERRHLLPPLALTLWRDGRITTGKLHDVLGVPVNAELIEELSELYGEPMLK